jgi:amino acid transporter
VQGIIVSVLAVMFALIPSVSSAFWILSAMAVQLYLIMYMMMFLSALKLRKIAPDVSRGFRVPAMSFFGWLGFVASLAAFFLGFVVPSGTTANQLTYALFLIVGIAILGCGPFIFYARRRPDWDMRSTPPASAVATADPQSGDAR